MALRQHPLSNHLCHRLGIGIDPPQWFCARVVGTARRSVRKCTTHAPRTGGPQQIQSMAAKRSGFGNASTLCPLRARLPHGGPASRLQHLVLGLAAAAAARAREARRRSWPPPAAGPWPRPRPSASGPGRRWAGASVRPARTPAAGRARPGRRPARCAGCHHRRRQRLLAVVEREKGLAAALRATMSPDCAPAGRSRRCWPAAAACRRAPAK